MGAATTVRRRLEWIDTDAANRWHYTTMFRYVEAAEAQLHRELGLSDRTFGYTPRVHVEADFQGVVLFDDDVELRFVVASVGRTAVTYDAELVKVADAAVVATARVVSVYIDLDTGRPAPWPEDIAATLRGETS